MGRLDRILPVAVAAAMVASPLASHMALAFGQGYDAALALAAVQAVAAGFVLWPVLRGRWRALAALGPAALLVGLGCGARRSAADGLLAGAGLGHAMLYAGLLALFGASLAPGRVAIVTRLARRLNPRFHAGMVPYTRGVTLAWCLFFALQLVASAALLALGRLGWWLLLVGSLNVPMVAGMALLEFAVRRWRFRHEHYTGLRETIRGVRLSAGPAGAAGAAGGASRPAAGCRAHNGSATRRPPPGAGSGPGPAA